MFLPARLGFARAPKPMQRRSQGPSVKKGVGKLLPAIGKKIPASAKTSAKTVFTRIGKIMGAGLATTLRQNRLLFTRAPVFFYPRR